MCLAVPTRIVELTGDRAVVEIGGVRREANVSFIESPAVGDYVLLHAGFAIEKWSEEDVREYNEIVREALLLDEAPSPQSSPKGRRELLRPAFSPPPLPPGEGRGEGGPKV